MAVVFLQNVGHFTVTGDLTLKTVPNDECWNVIFESFSGFVYIALHRIYIIGPALQQMCNIPVWWEVIAWMAP